MGDTAMKWYRVTKTIKGRRYHYLQRTFRVGNSVKTENKYIGPAGSSSRSRDPSPAPTYSGSTPLTPQDARRFFPSPATPTSTSDAGMDKVLQRRQQLIAQHAAGRITVATLERRLAANDAQYEKLAHRDTASQPDKVAQIFDSALKLIESASKPFHKPGKRSRKRQR